MQSRGTQILLVEDDESIRETLSEVLRDEGFIVKSAPHGRCALDMLHQGLRPQLILLDLMMPVMDGWELLAELRQSKDLGHIPVVVVSAARDGVPEGATNFLRKPLDLDHLLRTVEIFCSATPMDVPCAAVSDPPGATVAQFAGS